MTLDFRALFDALPTAFLVMTPDLVIVEANPAYLTLVGRCRDDIVGRPVFEAFPPTPGSLDDQGRNPVQVSFERARDSGRVDPMPIAQYDVADPVTGEVRERFWSLISAPVLDADGRTVLVMQRTEDVTDYVRERRVMRDGSAFHDAWQRRAEAVEADLYARVQELRAAEAAREVAATRLARLSEVALQLTAAETLDDLERIVVGRGLSVVGADGGAIIVEAPDGGWRLTTSAVLGEHVQLAYGSLPYDSPLPGCWAARTGQRLVLPSRESGLAYHPAMAQVYDDTQRLAWAFLPLRVSDETLGSLAVSWAEEHPLPADEAELLDGFAAQCAQALQRIRSTEAERRSATAARRMSEALQRTLLTQPAIPPPLQVAVRYLPASQEAQVGGDWHDAFTTSTGATLLVVGDVSGHDRAAAAVMGQVRSLLRGAAYDSDGSPALLLGRLDAALAGLQLEGLATAVLARVEHVGATYRLRWANAGHLPPLLRLPDGEVVVLDAAHDLLLGLDASTSRGEHVADLPPGSTVLLYTDGLVERRTATLDEGIAALAKVLGVEGAAEPEVLSDRLLATVGPSAEDDVALLALRVPDASGGTGTGTGAVDRPRAAA